MVHVSRSERRQKSSDFQKSLCMFYTPFSKKEGVYCFSSVLPSVRPSVLCLLTNIFRHTFLSNHVLQPLQTWCGASAMGPTCHLPNSHPPVIYFLFYNLLYSLWHNMVKFSYHSSQQP